MRHASTHYTYVLQIYIFNVNSLAFHLLENIKYHSGVEFSRVVINFGTCKYR